MSFYKFPVVYDSAAYVQNKFDKGDNFDMGRT